MSEIILLRHGATEWSKSGRHTGRTDVPLTPDGEQQAHAIGKALNHDQIGAVWSSPASRAMRSAELAGLTIDHVDADLWEWDYGGYEGVTTAQIQQTQPGWSLWVDGVIPGGQGFPGETVQQVGERCDRVLAQLVPLVSSGSSQAHGKDIALVAHGHLLRVLTARWLGLPSDRGALFRLDTGTISRLGFEHDDHVISAWNQMI